MDTAKDIGGFRSLARWIRDATGKLVSAGIDPREARNEVLFVLAHFLDCSVGEVLALEGGGAVLPPEIFAAAERVIKSRIDSRRPLAYLLGEWEFYGLKFFVDERVLIPRPETEILVDAALERISGGALTGCDLGTGSGAIGVAILKNAPAVRIVGVDISEDALAVAVRNARRHGVDERFFPVLGDMAECIARCDFVVCNPPYIPADDLPKLQPEVGFEPQIALAAGEDGLAFFRRLAESLPGLRPRFAVVEFGFGQEEAVRRIFADFCPRILHDFAGNPRAAVMEW